MLASRAGKGDNRRGKANFMITKIECPGCQQSIEVSSPDVLSPRHLNRALLIMALLLAGACITIILALRAPGDWEYDTVHLQDPPNTINSHGNYVSYTLKILGAEDTLLSTESDIASISDIMRAVAPYKWELVWISADERKFIVRRPWSKTGSFQLTENPRSN